MRSSTALFRPYRLKDLALRNRVVMAPMTRSFSPHGVPTPEMAAYYRRRAEHGVGLILTEGTGIDRAAALDDPNAPRLHGEAALAGWAHVVQEVHAAGGRIAAQLWHVGQKPSRSSGPGSQSATYESPSGLSLKGEPVGMPMSDETIADTIDAYARAARDARRLGFDGVEIHGAHGYLVDQFFSADLNRRTDRYGGASLIERSRFAVEVLKTIRSAVDPGFPVILRVSLMRSQGQALRLAQTPAVLEEWLGVLVDAGADAFHLSQPHFWTPAFPDTDPELSLAGWAKKLTGLTAIAVGSVGLDIDVYESFAGATAHPAPLDDLLWRLERDEFDLVAVGRALLRDPRWLEKVRGARADRLHDVTPADLDRLS